MNQNKVTALITIFLTFILFMILQPGDDPLALIRIASIVAGIVLVLIVIYSRFLWKVEPFSRLHKIIDISGVWQGKLPLENDKEIVIEMRIKQYFDDVKISIISEKNHSESMITKIVHEPDCGKLYVVYKCRPHKGVDTKEDIDYGTLMLRIDEDILEGEYFNNKSMAGHVELYRKK